MKCPKCHEEFPSRECPECGKKAPLLGKFCCHCGSELGNVDVGKTDVDGVEHHDEKIDFSERVLCSDGTCIGVINEQGVCNECGKPYTGEAD
jgi:hypothetical protein